MLITYRKENDTRINPIHVKLFRNNDLIKPLITNNMNEFNNSMRAIHKL